MEEIRKRYVSFFEELVDRAIAGEEVRVNFGPAVLDLYLEDGELHWKVVEVVIRGQ